MRCGKGCGLLLQLLVLLLPLLPLGCTGSFVTAVGPNQDVTFFSDFPVGDARRDLLRGLLSEKVDAPVRPESPFSVDRADSTGFRQRRDWRNLVFLADMTGRTWSARLCRRVLGEERICRLTQRPADYAFARNVWANGQTVLFVHAASAEALAELLGTGGAVLLERFDDRVIDGLKETLYVSGEQMALAEGICRRHGFRIRIPNGFHVEEQVSNRFVRMKSALASGAVMFFFIYYQEQLTDTLDPHFCMAMRDTIAAVYCGNDWIERSRTEVKQRRFLRRDALEIYGLYQNNDPPMGGPFKLICFHEGGRLYLIDLAVFNPPAPKRPQLRILEAIARTFETEPQG